MSELEPRRRARRGLARRRIPSEVVPVPFNEVHEFVRDALVGTSLLNGLAQVEAGWFLFAPSIRFTPVDDAHTRIELDLVGKVWGVEVLLNAQRIGEIDRFFIALQDELARRERSRPEPPDPGMGALSP